MVFLPRNEVVKARCMESIEKTVAKEKLAFLGWREVPTNNSCLGESVNPMNPQFFKRLLNARTMTCHRMTLNGSCCRTKAIT